MDQSRISSLYILHWHTIGDKFVSYYVIESDIYSFKTNLINIIIDDKSVLEVITKNHLNGKGKKIVVSDIYKEEPLLYSSLMFQGKLKSHIRNEKIKSII